jgi:hypothetical protein
MGASSPRLRPQVQRGCCHEHLLASTSKDTDDLQIVWHLFLGDLACLVIELWGVHGDFGIGFLQETLVWQMMILICPLSWANYPKSNIDFGMGSSTILLNAKETAKISSSSASKNCK